MISITAEDLHIKPHIPTTYSYEDDTSIVTVTCGIVIIITRPIIVTYDCIDDDELADADDAVCDDFRDGLTKEEEEAYERECEMLAKLEKLLRKTLGYSGFEQYKQVCKYHRW